MAKISEEAAERMDRVRLDHDPTIIERERARKRARVSDDRDHEQQQPRLVVRPCLDLPRLVQRASPIVYPGMPFQKRSARFKSRAKKLFGTFTLEGGVVAAIGVQVQATFGFAGSGACAILLIALLRDLLPML